MDEARFIELFGANRERARLYLLAATRDEAITEDLLQEVAVALWRGIDAYDPERPFLPWMLGMARIELLRWRRRAGRSRLVFGEKALASLASTAAGRAPVPDHRLEHLQACIAGLAEGERELLRLRYAEGLDLKAVAERTARSVGSVRMGLQRIRDALRKCIECKERESS